MSIKIIFCLHFLFFFFNDTATTEIYPLSLHDALPIYLGDGLHLPQLHVRPGVRPAQQEGHDHRAEHDVAAGDRKSTRLNSSHSQISYAVFCLKKKKKK